MQIKVASIVYDLLVSFSMPIFTSCSTKLAFGDLSKWAISFYIIFFILLGICIILWICNRNRRQILIVQKVKEEKESRMEETKLEFFTNVMHELSTPLMVINEIAEQMDKEAITFDEIRKYTEVLQNNVDSLNELIQKILDFSKMEALRFETKNIRMVNKIQEHIHVSESSPESSSQSKPTLLVVDDNKDIVWIIQHTLSEDYVVKNVYDGMDALKSLKIETPALIIIDIMIPADSLELIKNIKANKYTRQIPIIVISAKISDKEQAESIDAGADAYLTKPFSHVVLHSLVKHMLTKKEELKGYYYSPESAYEYLAGGLLHQDDKDFMTQCLSIIEKNIGQENLRPEFIANKLGVSTRNLYRRFKRITSSSPNDFIKDYRFKLAAQLLVTTNLTSQEIIYKIGITNKSYFYREFAKKYKVTPREYRSRIEN